MSSTGGRDEVFRVGVHGCYLLGAGVRGEIALIHEILRGNIDGVGLAELILVHVFTSIRIISPFLALS